MGTQGAGMSADDLQTDEDAEHSVIEDRMPRPPQMQRLGRYRLVREIASGGMASVNLAVADGVDKLVALKMIHANLAQEDAFVQMFLDEARIASAICHRNVCNVFDFGEVDGRFFIAMDFLSGQSLRDVIHRLRKMPDLATPERLAVFAATIISEACEGLHAAHELRDTQGEPLSVIHRDVSPHNLFVTYDGGVSVVDFGIARASDRIQHTATGILKGKFSYMAPEQIRQVDIDRRVDVWSLGVCLWEALTLERLFVRHSQADTLMSVMMDSVQPPSEVHPGVPPALDDIVMRALARNPAQRYATARELGRDLAKFVRSTGQPMDAVEIEQWLARLFPGEIDANRRLLRNARLASMEESQWAEGTPAGLACTPTRSGAMLRARISLTGPIRSQGPSHAPPLHAPPDEALEGGRAPATGLRPTGRPEGWGGPMVAALVLALCAGALLAMYANLSHLNRSVAIAPPTPAPQPRAAPRPPPSPPSNAGALVAEPLGSVYSEASVAPVVTQPSTKSIPFSPRRVHTRDERPMPSAPAVNEPQLSTATRTAPARRTVTDAPEPAPASAGAAELSAAPKPVSAVAPPAPSAPVVLDAPVVPRRTAPVVAVPVARPTLEPVPRTKARLDATVRVSGLDVAGSLGTGVVGRMLTRAEPLLRHCYIDAAKRAGKDAYLPVAVALTIDETGAVRKLETSHHPLTGLSDCVAGELKRMRSNRKPDVGIVHVRFSVGFNVP